MAAMTQSSPDAARNRYNSAFSSSIFDGPSQPKQQAFVPAGKRRDQTTQEMFGSYAEKDLRSMPKTFVPKEDLVSPRNKKLQFLNSEVLPVTGYAPPPKEAVPRREYASVGYPEHDEDESKVNTQMVRQMHLSSSMFGRPTPDQTQERDPRNRLMPNDFVWHNYPEATTSPTSGQGKSHADRAYEQKCSKVFDHQSPEMRNTHADLRRQDKMEEQTGDQRRRANVYYSDLFGRSAGYGEPNEAQTSARRPKCQGSHEEELIVHQDWTDSRTELLRGARGGRPDEPHLRKQEELHKSRIFEPANRGDWQYPAKNEMEAVTHDNSSKVRAGPGMTTQQIHQAHLQTSTQNPSFYQQASETRDWEVIELHISGLPHDADDQKLRSLCSGFDVQLVKCKADIDPVRNLCKGRAKITVRYNPVRDSIQALVAHLENGKLKVET
eukprot:TRINITY_DN60891_c0_g1_i1.p1 TRINITY_DN60891_c0_g1~~TRINITY_DN60891_c0_g1_i1.p1  ORF type:complete len:461 (-),score=75.57 TRINITY_DN60891_c0_g1_i1:173-1486(-)